MPLRETRHKIKIKLTSIAPRILIIFPESILERNVEA